MDRVESGFHHVSNRSQPQDEGEDGTKHKALLLEIPSGDAIEPFPEPVLHLLSDEIRQETEGYEVQDAPVDPTEEVDLERLLCIEDILCCCGGHRQRVVHHPRHATRSHVCSIPHPLGHAAQRSVIQVVALRIIRQVIR